MKNFVIGIIDHKETISTLREALINNTSLTYDKNEYINTKDIYQYVGISLMSRNYHECSLEEKSVMVEEELKKYLAHKLAYFGYFISNAEAIKTDISELLTKLYELSLKNAEMIYQFTHYVLGLLSEIQYIQTIWYVEDDESYILNPTLEVKNEVLDKVITHKDTDPVTTFNLVFSYYIEKCNKKNLNRTRKKEELPKTGE